MPIDAFPQVQGKCPACGWGSLFLGDGGYVTCSRIECSQPDAASCLLEETEAVNGDLAAALERHLENFFREWPEERRSSPWAHGWADATSELRRLAAETQGTDPSPCVARLTALYEQWVKAGPPPLGKSTSRWWDRRLTELHAVLTAEKQDTGDRHSGLTAENKQ